MRGDKGYRKKIDKHCAICQETNEKVLDVHRIVEGCNGGEYNLDNSVRLCSNCHRRVHHDNIEIIGWVISTNGRLLHVIIDGVEDFIKP